MIELDRSFTQYLEQLKQELKANPDNFIPPYPKHNKPYAEWTEEQKQKQREYSKRYSKSHPEKMRQQAKLWHDRNREKYNASARRRWPKYYAKHKEEILAKRKEKYYRSKGK